MIDNLKDLDSDIDARLVDRFKSGDEEAFDQIVARYRQKVFSISFSILQNYEDAEEITQDTFVCAYRGLKRFRGNSSFFTWLYRIATNLSLNRYWYRIRHGKRVTFSIDDTLNCGCEMKLIDILPSGERTPDQEITSEEFLKSIISCTERLDEKFREAIKMRNIDSFSYEEIALALGIKVGTVKSRLTRARSKLRALLAETYPEFST